MASQNGDNIIENTFLYWKHINAYHQQTPSMKSWQLQLHEETD